jgi:hypothetical protein
LWSAFAALSILRRRLRLLSNARHEIGRERRQLTQLIICPAEFDRHVGALDVAGFSEALTERSHEVPIRSERPRVEKPDHWHGGLLRARREQPRTCRAAQWEYEFSPSDVDCHATLQLEVVCMQ